MTTSIPAAPPAVADVVDLPGHDWRVAGDAWGHRATDWACLFEHYAHEVVHEMFAHLEVGDGVELLDVACGSGAALRHAIARGARGHGLDASAALLAVARARMPVADLRHASMFDLPWAVAAFDAVVSVNGIWGGCQGAVDEVARVLRPGGRFAFSFWGTGAPLDLRPVFRAFARHAPRPHLDGMRRTNDIASPGVAEDMVAAAGLELVTRGQRVSTIEWPDAELAWRALTSTGPAVPALRYGDVDALRRDVLEAIEPCRGTDGVYRMRNDHRFVVARKARPAVR